MEEACGGSGENVHLQRDSRKEQWLKSAAPVCHSSRLYEPTLGNSNANASIRSMDAPVEGYLPRSHFIPLLTLRFHRPAVCRSFRPACSRRVVAHSIPPFNLGETIPTLTASAPRTMSPHANTTALLTPTLTIAKASRTQISIATAIARSSNQSDPPDNEPPSTEQESPESDPHAPTPLPTGNGNRPSGTIIALTMTPLCLSVLLSALDLTIVTPAIPAIVSSFHSPSGSGYVWVGGAFVLASTAITPVWGSVADIWGRKPIMLVAQALFFGGSLLCALARDMEGLVAGRAVQGLGASGMGTMVNVIICDTFSPRDRGLYLAVTSVVWAVGSAVGPVVGGSFTTKLG